MSDRKRTGLFQSIEKEAGLDKYTSKAIAFVKLTVFLLIFSFLIAGCVTEDKIEGTLDLTNNTMTTVFYNIRSDGKDANAVEDDFKSLIKEKQSDPFGVQKQGGEYLSTELYESDAQLNSKSEVKFPSLEKMLQYAGITIDKDGSYYTKTIDQHIVGNGVLKKVPEGSILWWPKETKLITFKYQENEKPDSSTTSLLQKWREWKAQQNE